MIIDLREQAGVAMNARGQLSDPIADPQVTLGALAFANDLGRLLWRMKYGQDVKRSGLQRATLLLAKAIREQRRFQRSKFTGLDRQTKRERNAGKQVEHETVDLIERLARRAVLEWVDDQCPRCDGRGVIGRVASAATSDAACPACNGDRYIVDEHLVPFAARRDGKGPMVVYARERCDQCNGTGRAEMPAAAKRIGRQICPDCEGTGRRAPNHSARAIALGVSLRQYRAHWERMFRPVFVLLDELDGAAHDTVRFLVKR